MNKYTYWSNKTKAHEKEMLVVYAKDILDADETFKKETGFDPIKCPWIGCCVEFNVNPS